MLTAVITRIIVMLRNENGNGKEATKIINKNNIVKNRQA